jgi:hypothetical protein
MRRREALLEQQAHRVAFVAECRAGCRRRRCRSARPARRSKLPSLCCLPGAGPHCAFDLLEPALAPTWSSAGMRRARWRGAEALGVALDDRVRAARPRWRACRPCSPRACIAGSVLCSDSNTDRKAAVPVLPALGGKLNTTSATLRSARSLRRSATSARRARPACRCARCSCACPASSAIWPSPKVQPARSRCRWPGAPARPPNTIGPVAPSSSGMATIMVLPPAAGRVGTAPLVQVWNSTGVRPGRARPACGPACLRRPCASL